MVCGTQHQVQALNSWDLNPILYGWNVLDKQVWALKTNLQFTWNVGCAANVLALDRKHTGDWHTIKQVVTEVSYWDNKIPKCSCGSDGRTTNLGHRICPWPLPWMCQTQQQTIQFFGQSPINSVQVTKNLFHTSKMQTNNHTQQRMRNSTRHNSREQYNKSWQKQQCEWH